MSDPAAPFVSPARRWSWKRLGLNFLTISILGHVLFGFVATYLIVQKIQQKRSQTFAGAPNRPNTASRAIEHKVQMQKKQQTMSAPVPMKRVTTMGNSKVSLPSMPAMPAMDSAVKPLAMSGMSGMGLGLSMGGGNASGGSTGERGPNLFGFRDHRGGNGFVGTFYDLKQSRGGQPTNMAGGENPSAPQEGAANDNDRKTVRMFITSGFSDGVLGSFFRGLDPLYSTQIFIPTIDANDGPKSFNLADKVKPRRWLVVYKANVTAPESGSYRFIGTADDYIMVRFNGRLVMDGSIANVSGKTTQKTYNLDGLGGSTPTVAVGDAVDVQAGTNYPLEVVIGELPGGVFRAVLLLEKAGVEYQKDSKGNPLLPVFKLAKSENTKLEGLPAVSSDTSWSVWKAVPASSEN